MKKIFSISIIFAIALGFAHITWAQTTPICIDNEINGDGAWQVCVEAGGETRTGNLDPTGSATTTEIIYDYFHYVDVGANGNAAQLSSTSTSPPPVLSGQNQVTSTGQFQGENGQIAWTAVSSIAPDSPVYQTVLTFSSLSPIGSLRLIQYLDEDISAGGISDDILVVEGIRGNFDFRLRTNDGNSNVGVAHAANYLTANNMKFVGWAADEFSDLQDSITGTGGTTYSIEGVVDTADLPVFSDSRFPGLDTFGPEDVTSAIAFDVDPNATTASVIFTLGGLPQISSADLSISQAASPNPVQGNTTLTYTLAVTNIGPDPATEVTVQDTLPNGVSLTTTPTSCTSDSSSNTVTCALGTIASNATAIPITIDVTPPVDCIGTPFSNTATVSANEVDSTPSNNTDVVSTSCVLQLQIAPPTVSLTSGDGINFSASGGVPPYTFSFVANPSGGTISSSPNSTTADYLSGPTNVPVMDMIGVSDSAGFTAVATVSVAPAPLVTVPNVVGETQAVATAAINGVTGLSVGGVTQENSATVPTGNVIRQNPGPGSVPSGTTVTLIVSLGPVVFPPVTVPNVVGQTQAAASAAINGVTGLTVGAVTQANSATVAAGTIISQNPASGSVPSGSTVAFVVSLGPVVIPPVTVPNVVGQTQTAATAAINAIIGLSVGAVTQANSTTVAAGNVISQNPGPNSVPAGSTVALVVSSGPAVVPLVTVPNIVGQTQAAATTAINTITGLNVGAVTQTNNNTVAAGNVISQNPGPGSAPAGTTVALVVSSGTDLTVTDSADNADASPGDGVCSTGANACTLRAAIQEANAFAGEQTITLAPGTYTLALGGANEDGAITGDLDITDDVIIESSTGNANDVVITADALDRVFDMPPGNSPSLTLRGLTIQGGVIVNARGGGIRNAQGTLTIENSLVMGNQSNGSGGGISHLGGTLTLRNTMVMNNISEGMGGGLQAQAGTVTIEANTLFMGNTANFGGGLSTGGADVTLADTRVEDNTATGGGGGIYKILSLGDLLATFQAPRVELSNTTFRNNTINDCEGYLVDGGNNTISTSNRCTLLTP